MNTNKGNMEQISAHGFAPRTSCSIWPLPSHVDLICSMWSKHRGSPQCVAHEYRKKHRSYVYSKRVLYLRHVTVGGQTIQHRMAEAQHGQVTTIVCLSREGKREGERRGEGDGEGEAGRQRQTERGRERQMCAISTAKRLGHALGVAASSREVYHVVTVSTYD